jgi:hypothetical protein
MRVRPFGVCIVTCLGGLLAAAVTGCGAAGTAGTVAATAAPSISSASPASPTASASSAGPTAAAALDAKTLDSELLPVGDMPKGYVSEKSLSRYNGVALPDDSPSPVAGAQLCQILTETSWIRASGLTTPDFAEAAFGNTARTEEVYEEIVAFQGADAQKAMTALWQAFGRCANFTEAYGGMNAKIALTRSMIGGQWAGIKSVQLTPAFVGGDTAVAIRVGYAIVTVFDSTESSDDGSAAISMAERIAGRVSAAEAGQ